MRPPAPVRVTVLVAAVACLGLAMCAHSPSRSTDVQSPQYAPSQTVQPQAAPQATPQAAPAPRQQAVTPAQRPPASPPAKAPPPTYFPATKAAPALYPQ